MWSRGQYQGRTGGSGGTSSRPPQSSQNIGGNQDSATHEVLDNMRDEDPPPYYTHHQLQQQDRGGAWGTPRWPQERKSSSSASPPLFMSVDWTELEDETLRKSVKDNGLDDWTLGDWSEVRSTERRSKFRCIIILVLYFIFRIILGHTQARYAV